MAASKIIKSQESNVLPIEEADLMPTEDVSDLREVVDAINKLCETMKTSYDESDEEDVVVEDVDTELVNPTEVVVKNVETHVAESWTTIVDTEMVTVEDVESDLLEDLETHNWTNTQDVIVDTDNVLENVHTVDSINTQTHYYYKDTQPDLTVAQTIISEEDIETIMFGDTEANGSDTEQTLAPCEPISEMYYTASSELSLLSETDLADKLQNEDSDKEKGTDRVSVMAGHVAAMRERFESMTRANTPNPDLIRSLSPSLDMFRNITPSPDFLDKS